jgi:YD repeat-containing protein
VAITQDAWYAYDKLNRVAVNNGMLSGGQVVLKQGDNSYAVSYDAVGNAVAQQRWMTVGGSSTLALKTTHQSYSLRGEVTLSTSEGYSTQYVYDAAGRVTESRSYFASGTRFTWIDDEGNEIQYPMSGMLASSEAYTYDDDGRLLTQVSRSRSQVKVERFPVGYPAKPSKMLLAWVGEVHDGTGTGALGQSGSGSLPA